MIEYHSRLLIDNSGVCEQRERERERGREGGGRSQIYFHVFLASDGVGERNVVAPIAAGEQVSHS